MTIDWWTLGIQAVNVLVLVWLLGRFFWKPMAAMIDERRATVQRQLDDVRHAREQAEAEQTRITAERDGLAKAREDALVATRAEVEQTRNALLAAARAEADAQVAQAAGRIVADRHTALAGMRDASARLAIDIAGRLAARLDGEAVHDAFLHWLVDAIARLPASTRAGVASEGIVLDAISAKPLGEAAEARCRTRIEQAFGAQPRLAFRTDPALIAGIELHGPHFVVANSWRADLEQIMHSLKNGGDANDEHDAPKVAAAR